MSENNGKEVRIEPAKKKVSSQLRAYYFGAVIPALKQTNEQWEKLTSEELHEVIKKMFFYFETYNPITKRTERFGRSVMKESDWNNTAKAMEFLEVLADYLAQCGIDMPDPEQYKQWRDSAPDVGEDYKPNKRK